MSLGVGSGSPCSLGQQGALCRASPGSAAATLQAAALRAAQAWLGAAQQAETATGGGEVHRTPQAPALRSTEVSIKPDKTCQVCGGLPCGIPKQLPM